MSGIFHLISKYQNRHKLLTFGRKHEKKLAVSTQSSLVKQQQQQQPNNHKIVISLLDKVQDSDMVPRRSPALSQKIRRSSSSNVDGNNNNNNRPPPALLTRLMGLEEEEERQPGVEEVVYNNNNNHNKIVDQRGGQQISSSTEAKRQRLLQALEKCNEDLEALKKIIVAAQASKKTNLQSSMAKKENKEEIINEPNSPLMKNCYNNNKLHAANGNLLQQRGKKMVGKKPGEEDEGIEDIWLLNRLMVTAESSLRRIKRNPSSFCSSSSKAMIESVNEVCDDIAWGEKRELGNIGLTLQNQIFKDLIEDSVQEFTSHLMLYPPLLSLPFHACKRRLSFK